MQHRRQGKICSAYKSRKTSLKSWISISKSTWSNSISPKRLNNFVFGKTIENVRKHRDVKLVTTDEKRNKLVSESNYHTTKTFFIKFVSNRNEKNKSKNE